MVVTSICHEIDLWMGWPAGCGGCCVVVDGRAFGSGHFPCVLLTHRVCCVSTCLFSCMFLTVSVTLYVDSILTTNMISQVFACRRAHTAVTPQEGRRDAHHTGGLSAHGAATITESLNRGWRRRRATTAFPRRTHAYLGSRHLATNGHQDGCRWLSGSLRLRVARAWSGLCQTWFHRAQANTRDDFPWSAISRPLTWQ